MRQPPLICHLIHHLGTGGLENGLVNLIDRTPEDRYRHAILCLQGVGGFAGRLQREVPILSLDRTAGHSFSLYGRAWRALRGLRPALVHTRNLSALEMQIPARLLPGVRRVHGVHGRDLFDLHGRNRKYLLLRRAIRPLVERYTAVSRDLADWLVRVVGVAPERVRQIYNGVDQERFRPRQGPRPDLDLPFALPADALVIGTVGRLAGVKDQATLVRAFARLRERRPQEAGRLFLALVGDGPERERLEDLVRSLGLGPWTWLAGERDDVPECLRLMDVFVLPSLGEGISNTLLEAQASGLPVVATRVGGNPELVADGDNGFLVPAADAEALAAALERYLEDPSLRGRQGAAGLRRVRERFHWDRCVEAYLGLYDELLFNRR